MKKYITLITALLCFALNLFAQGGSLPILRLNADVRTAGMGDANMAEATAMYSYTNPTSFLLNETQDIYASYTYGMFPKVNNDRIIFHAASIGYKGEKQAILLGFRYLGGLEVTKTDMDGLPEESLKPYDYTIDLTYTLELKEHFSAYLTGTFVQSYIGKTAYTGSVSGGVYYRDYFTLSNTIIDCTIGAGFYDLGSTVKYEKKEYDQPTSVGLGGSLGAEITDNQKLNIGWTVRYFTLPTDASEFTGGLGLEYELFQRANFRAGYHFEDTNSHTSLGLGFKMDNFHIDVAYKIAAEKDVDDSLLLGCSLNF